MKFDESFPRNLCQFLISSLIQKSRRLAFGFCTIYTQSLFDCINYFNRYQYMQLIIKEIGRFHICFRQWDELFRISATYVYMYTCVCVSALLFVDQITIPKFDYQLIIMDCICPVLTCMSEKCCFILLIDFTSLFSKGYIYIASIFLKRSKQIYIYIRNTCMS